MDNIITDIKDDIKEIERKTFSANLSTDLTQKMKVAAARMNKPLYVIYEEAMYEWLEKNGQTA